jgi:hypothetical protein
MDPLHLVRPSRDRDLVRARAEIRFFVRAVCPQARVRFNRVNGREVARVYLRHEEPAGVLAWLSTVVDHYYQLMNHR